MAKSNISINTPQKGMNRDSHESQLSEKEYSYMLNGNFQDEHGNGPILLQNEGSNILCSTFKPGYFILGFKYSVLLEKTYFFLHNPTTGVNEVGYISNTNTFTSLAQIEETCGCNLTAVEDTPLENQVQLESCTYNTLVSDTCLPGKLGFSLNNPIYESNIEIKIERFGATIYFTDNLNPPRYLKLNSTGSTASPIYTTNTDACTGEETSICLDVDKMRIFRLFDKPCLEVSTVVEGGNLRAGMYEVLVAYCNLTGDVMSEFYSMTNLISIWSKNNNILEQTDLAYRTNQAITVNISNLDQDYEFFKVVVIHHSGLDGAVNYLNYGVYPTDVDKVIITTVKDKVKTTLAEILTIKPYILKSKGLSNTNGYLLQYGLEEHRELNLQPIANLLGAFANWSTIQAKENLYEDGEYVSKYKSAMRDEVYPYSIRFNFSGGYTTANYVLVPRPAIASELTEVDNLNTQSILAYSPDCSETARLYKWQYQNTATVIGDCTVPVGAGITTVEDVRVVTNSCLVTEIATPDIPKPVATIATGNITLTTSLGLVEYINTNYQDIVDYAGADAGILAIQAVIEDASIYADSCTPSFGDVTCGTPTLLTPTLGMFAIGAATETSTSVAASVSDYPRVDAPALCNTVNIDFATGSPTIDTDFRLYTGPLSTVYKRQNVTNISGTTARNVTAFSEPQIDSPRHLLNKGATTVAGLQTAITVQAYTNYTTKLHTNAIWFKVDFGAKTKKIIEISQILCDYSDANTGTDMRVSFFGSESATSDIASYSKHIANTSVFVAGTHFIELTKADFSSGFAYIAIDSPMKVANGITKRIGLSGTSGGADIKINNGGGDVTFSITYDNLSTLASNFVSTRGPDVRNWTGADVTNSGSDLTFYLNTGGTVTITNTSGDLGGTAYATQTYFVLTPPCGCFNIFKRDYLETKSISYTGLTFGKRQNYSASCTFQIPVLGNCKTAPHKKGLFSYWESVEKYPCNMELYDSSSLVIAPNNLSSDARTVFQTHYVTTIPANPSNPYVLNSKTNLVDKPIRHYKYPDNSIIPFINTKAESAGDFKNSIIYPIGFSLDPNIINDFLDIAVNNNLLTLAERSKIISYEIYRGDRRISKSIIAKGLAFDMLSEGSDVSDALYSNYPLNTLGPDLLNGTTDADWYSSRGNINYSFHSPNTQHEKPTLPREIAIDGYMFGKSKIYFDTVDRHPTYTILGDGAFQLATTLAILESTLEILSKTAEVMTLGASGGLSSPLAIGIATVSLGAWAISEVMKTGEYRLQWIKTLYELGKPTNHAYYQAAIGHYNYFTPNSVTTSRLRGLSISHYLREGMWNVADEYSGKTLRINNLDREDSVLLSLKDDAYKLEYPVDYIGYDNSNIPANATRRGYEGVGRSPELVGNAASPYITLKQYSPSQYGTINSINWLSTGFCGDLSGSASDCETTFGGDIFISRFAVKRKFPFFTTTAFGLAPLTPFTYSNYFNIKPTDSPLDISFTRRFLNYKTIDEEGYEVGIGSAFFPSQKSQYSLEYLQSGTHTYVNPEAKFYLYSYGFPHFLVESEINCNFRYAGIEDAENFYPNVGDIIRYTQEKNVSIREPERFNYNNVYSSTNTITNWRVLPTNYSKVIYDKLAFSPNGVVVSNQDNSETSLTDPWLVYNALNSHQFPTENGTLVSLDSIESEITLVRFTNGVTLFESDQKIIEKLATQSKSFNKTDLGYAGTQHRAMVSNEFGHFWVDAMRGKVFTVQPGGKGLDEIPTGVEKWLKANLPFKILNTFPTIDVDNTFKGIGIAMGWDDRLKRVFITKKDYKVKTGTSSPLLWNVTEDFYIIDPEDDVTHIAIQLGDPIYFIDCSWTIAYSPLTKTWISYYSFKPDYYISYNDHFKTGINYSLDSSEFGVWSHLGFVSSYQVFYGKLYPFTIEYALQTKYSQSVLAGVEYWLDVRKYYNQWDFTDTYGIGFNKAYVYSNTQNSGEIELVFQKPNNLYQQVQYPQYNTDSVSALQSEIGGKWSYNFLYNLVKNEASGLPIWTQNCSQTEKTLDSRLLSYKNNYKDRLRGDYFLNRLSNDKESRYKFIFRYGQDDRDYYEQ